MSIEEWEFQGWKIFGWRIWAKKQRDKEWTNFKVRIQSRLTLIVSPIISLRRIENSLRKIENSLTKWLKILISSLCESRSMKSQISLSLKVPMRSHTHKNNHLPPAPGIATNKLFYTSAYNDMGKVWWHIYCHSWEQTWYSKFDSQKITCPFTISLSSFWPWYTVLQELFCNGAVITTVCRSEDSNFWSQICW